MPDQAAKPKQNYYVHTIGGESLMIAAHDMSINKSDNRVYFLDADGKNIEKWIVLWSGVAAIEIRQPQPMAVSPLRI